MCPARRRPRPDLPADIRQHWMPPERAGRASIPRNLRSIRRGKGGAMLHSKRFRSGLGVAICIGGAALSLLLGLASRAEAVSSTVVISQVYGGGGNAGATYTHDFIEIFNRGSAAVDVTGWTVQYASSAGTTWATTALSGSIPAGGYYLIQEAQGAGGTLPLPTPEATGNIAMSATAAKVALVSNATALSGACPSGASIVDMVGFGAASCSEGTPLAALTNTTAAVRKSSGCEETDNNAADFSAVAPTPRNGASPTHSCQYTLDVTASPLAGGSIVRSPDAATYQHGTTVDLTAVPAAGYSFVAWSGDASGSTNPVTVA